MEGILIGFMLVVSTFGAQTEFGNLIGSFENEPTAHDITGTVYAVDDVSLYIRGFTYDGNSTCGAVFYAGNSESPQNDDDAGVVIPIGSGQSEVLSRPYQAEDLKISLPSNMITDHGWLAVRCSSSVIVAYVLIPDALDVPSPISLGTFEGRQHNVRADEVILVNTKQIKFVRLSYDGSAPGAVFWTGPSNPRDPTSLEVPHPPDNPVSRLPNYQRDRPTVTVTLPGDLTVADIGFIGIWCKPFRVDFGHVNIDLPVDDLPPIVEPPRKTTTVPSTVATTVPLTVSQMSTRPDLDNCQVLKKDQYHIAWSADSSNNKIILEFRGLVALNQYMAFGISGSESRTQMVGADVTVVWIDPSDSQPRAVDYHLSAYSQCIPTSGKGACPDALQEGEDNVELISGTTTNGVTIIRVERPLTPSDSLDTPFDLSGPVYVSWSIGFINPTGHTAKHDILPDRPPGAQVDFGSSSSQCPALKAREEVPDVPDPWAIEPFRPEGGATFVADIGPSGGQQGYQGIANQVGWGLAWYINDTLIPEIYVQRGSTYTFLIFGGDDDSYLGNYHPFYISDKLDGGYIQKETADQEQETIYAGPVVGPLCEFRSGPQGPEEFDQFLDYSTTLTKECTTISPTPGVLTWTVAEDTPDLVYYQCYQHRFFGWKIHVSDAAVANQMSTVTSEMSSVTSEMSAITSQMSSMFVLFMSFIVVAIAHW